jgi:hypothetical protein
MGKPASRRPAQTAESAEPYFPPEAGFRALKDATALILCLARGDREGLDAIIDGGGNPHELAAMTAMVTARICLRAGLSDSTITGLLKGIEAEIADNLLDQEQPTAGVTSHR